MLAMRQVAQHTALVCDHRRLGGLRRKVSTHLSPSAYCPLSYHHHRSHAAIYLLKSDKAPRIAGAADEQAAVLLWQFTEALAAARLRRIAALCPGSSESASQSCQS